MELSEERSVRKLTELSDAFLTVSSSVSPTSPDTFGSWHQVFPLLSTPKKPKFSVSPRYLLPKTAPKSLTDRAISRPAQGKLPTIASDSSLGRRTNIGTAVSRNRKKLRAHLLALSPYTESLDISGSKGRKTMFSLEPVRHVVTVATSPNRLHDV